MFSSAQFVFKGSEKCLSLSAVFDISAHIAYFYRSNISFHQLLWTSLVLMDVRFLFFQRHWEGEEWQRVTRLTGCCQIEIRFISEPKKPGRTAIRQCEKKIRRDLSNPSFSPEDCAQLNCQDKDRILIWQKHPKEWPTWVAGCRSRNDQKPAGIYALSARMIPVLTRTIRSRNVLLSQKDEHGAEKPGFKSEFMRSLGNYLHLRKKTENLYRH